MEVGTVDTEILFTKLEFNTGEFPEDALAEAVYQHGLIIPLLLEELRCAAADHEALSNKGRSCKKYKKCCLGKDGLLH